MSKNGIDHQIDKDIIIPSPRLIEGEIPKQLVAESIKRPFKDEDDTEDTKPLNPNDVEYMKYTL